MEFIAVLFTIVKILETPQMSIKKRMNEQTVMYSCSGILICIIIRNKLQIFTTIWMNLKIKVMLNEKLEQKSPV